MCLPSQIPRGLSPHFLSQNNRGNQTQPVQHQAGSSTWAQQEPLCPGLPPCWRSLPLCCSLYNLSPLLVHFCSFSLPVFPSCAQLGVGAVLTSQWSHLVLLLSLLFPRLPSLHISCRALLVLPFPALPISLLPPSKPFALLSPRSHPPTRCSHAHHVPSMQPTSHISWKTKPGSQSLKINIAWVVRDGFHWLNNSTLGLFSAF